jgi:Protein tyrosine and serine/threonine kinase
LSLYFCVVVREEEGRPRRSRSLASLLKMPLPPLLVLLLPALLPAGLSEGRGGFFLNPIRSVSAQTVQVLSRPQTGASFAVEVDTLLGNSAWVNAAPLGSDISQRTGSPSCAFGSAAVASAPGNNPHYVFTAAQETSRAFGMQFFPPSLGEPASAVQAVRFDMRAFVEPTGQGSAITAGCSVFSTLGGDTAVVVNNSLVASQTGGTFELGGAADAAVLAEIRNLANPTDVALVCQFKAAAVFPVNLTIDCISFEFDVLPSPTTGGGSAATASSATDSSAAADDGLGFVLYIIIGAGALVLIAAIAVFVVVSRKRNGSSGDDDAKWKGEDEFPTARPSAAGSMRGGEQNVQVLTGIEFKSVLGEGNFGEVRLADWNGVEVAVKKLKQNKTADVVEEFQRELRTLAGLVHPNIVRLLGIFVDEADGEECLVMEFQPLGTVLDIVQRERESLTVGELIELITGACRGFAVKKKCCFFSPLTFFFFSLSLSLS